MASASTIQEQVKKKRFRSWIQNYGYSIGSVAFFILLWELIVWITGVRPYLLPSPSLVVVDLVKHAQEIFGYSIITGYEILLGYFLSILVGIPIGLMIYYSKFLERTIYPFLVASQTVPKVAIAPLLVIWFGWGIWPKIIVAFLIAFFPIVIDTVVGLKATQPEMIYLVRSMGATRMQIFWKISLPNALPNIFGALKVAITLAVVGAVIGEFVASDQGLGYLLVVSQGYLDTPMMFAGIVALSALGIIFFSIIEIMEKIFIPWRNEEKGLESHATM